MRRSEKKTELPFSYILRHRSSKRVESAKEKKVLEKRDTEIGSVSLVYLIVIGVELARGIQFDS